MDYSCEPALLLYCLFGFHGFSLNWTTGISLRLLCTFLNEDFQNLQNTIEILWRLNLSLVSQEASSNFASDSPPRGIWLRMEERNKVG